MNIFVFYILCWKKKRLSAEDYVNRLCWKQKRHTTGSADNVQKCQTIWLIRLCWKECQVTGLSSLYWKGCQTILLVRICQNMLWRMSNDLPQHIMLERVPDDRPSRFCWTNARRLGSVYYQSTQQRQRNDISKFNKNTVEKK